MPTYDYYSEETGEYKEVFHGMNEEPEILDSKGNVMKKAFLPGHGGDVISGGGTRNRSWAARHGHKKTENMPTPSESAAAKASESAKQIGQGGPKYDPSNPYGQFK